MARRDIIVIGASAGGVRALSELVKGLPADLAASLFIVLHLPPWHKSHLPEILNRSGPLPAEHPESGQRIEKGRIYVAPPNVHMQLKNGHIELWQGPKENQHRPAINTLFRSAAVSHRENVAGVVLSGCLDDGSAGLWWIKRYGGAAIVQNPQSAEQPDMPKSALEYVDVDHVADLQEMPSLLTNLANGDEQPLLAGGAEDRAVWKPNR